MSKQYDIKQGILKLIENPEDKDVAVKILLDAVGQDEEDFEYDNDETPEQYIFG